MQPGFAPRRVLPAFAAILSLALLSPTVILAEPISLEELMQMGSQKVPADQILAAATARGLGFEITLPTERQLRRSGFSRAAIARLKRVEPPAAGPAAEPAAGVDAQPAAAKKKLDPALEAEYAAFDNRLDRIVKNSNTALVKVRSDHITVVSEKELSQRLLADVKKLEQLFAKQFPAPLGAGPDARKAVIVFTRTRYDYENYLESMFREYEADGLEFASPAAKKTAVAASNIVLDGMAVSCLEDATEEASRHQVAYGVGYHYMDQISGSKAPVSMVAGFGNYAETCLMGRPSVRLSGGTSGAAINRPQDSWPNLVRKQFADRKVNSLRQVINYDAGAMQTEDYAVCWSFMSLLSTGEEQLSKLVAEMRDGGDPLEQITQLYGLEQDKFLVKWKSFAAQQR